jgi:hypothetical protein
MAAPIAATRQGGFNARDRVKDLELVGHAAFSRAGTRLRLSSAWSL